MPAPTVVPATREMASNSEPAGGSGSRRNSCCAPSAARVGREASASVGDTDTIGNEEREPRCRRGVAVAAWVDESGRGKWREGGRNRRRRGGGEREKARRGGETTSSIETRSRGEEGKGRERGASGARGTKARWKVRRSFAKT
eukprot:scaffold32502_cov26-Tisochrysis_lutea.AAC.4